MRFLSCLIFVFLQFEQFSADRASLIYSDGVLNVEVLKDQVHDVQRSPVKKNTEHEFGGKILEYEMISEEGNTEGSGEPSTTTEMTQTIKPVWYKYLITATDLGTRFSSLKI